MAILYKIIGGDQKEYGMVSAGDMRKWIAEGRVNTQTLAKAEGDEAFRPLGGFPEFVDALAAAASAAESASAPGAVPAVGGPDRDEALRLVKGPAIGLLVTAILGLIGVAIGLAINILMMNGVQTSLGQLNDPQFQKFFSSLSGGLGIVQDVIGAISGVVVLVGASKMSKLQNHQFSMTAAVVAMLPCISPCCLFGLPFGIWALVVLNRPEVKSHFS